MKIHLSHSQKETLKQLKNLLWNAFLIGCSINSTITNLFLFSAIERFFLQFLYY